VAGSALFIGGDAVVAPTGHVGPSFIAAAQSPFDWNVCPEQFIRNCTDTWHIASVFIDFSLEFSSTFRFFQNYSYVDYKIIQLHIAFNILISLLLTHYYYQFINLFMNLIEEYCVIFTYSTNRERICLVKNIYKINNYNN